MPSKKKAPHHVYDVLRPLMAFSKVFGLTAFCLKGEPPYVQIEVTRANYASLLLNFAVNSFCVYLHVQNNRLSRVTGSAVMDTGLAFLFPFGAVIMIVLACDNFLRRRSTCAIIAAFFQVDRSLECKNYQVDHKRHLRVLSRILIVSVLLVTFGTIFSLVMAFTASKFSLRNHFINAFSYILTGLEFLIINFHFISAARLLAFRMSDIDHCLKRHLSSGNWWIERKDHWGRKLAMIDVIDELAEDFASLASIVERVNRIYANQIVGCIAGVSMFSIFVIYASAYSFFYGKAEEFHLTSILLTAWVFYVIMIGNVFSASADVANAIRGIVLSLHEATVLVENKTSREKLLCFSQQLFLREPKLQSLFYEFNWKTLFSLCGFIVTYLVILMQFDDISD